MDNTIVKTGYVSPNQGELALTLIRYTQPTVVLTLDLGIPNFTVFQLKYPLLDNETRAMTEITSEALNVLNDEVISFMLSLGYDQEVCVQICATVLACFKSFSVANDTQAQLPAIGQDDSIVTYEGRFNMPQSFVDETYSRVVTGANKVQRIPPCKSIKLSPFPPDRNTPNEVSRTIRMFRDFSLKSQPQPLYVMVYDMKGRPRGVVPFGKGNNFKNNIIKNLRKK